MHTNVTPPPLTGVPAPVAAVIMRLLAKDPAERFRTAAATRHALEEASLPFLSSDLATAVATTMPGRKKSMPPDQAVPMTAPTVQTLADGKVEVATRAAHAALAETITPVTPIAATPTAAGRPTALAAKTLESAPPRRRSPGLIAIVGAVVIMGAVAIFFLTRPGDAPPKTEVAPAPETPRTVEPPPPPPPAAVAPPIVVPEPPAIDAGTGSAEAITTKQPPRATPPRVRAPKTEPPKVEPPKVEPPKVEPPKTEPPKPKTTPW
jgi:hypothetical protein